VLDQIDTVEVGDVCLVTRRALSLSTRHGPR
jgi:hypothetical protein